MVIIYSIPILIIAVMFIYTKEYKKDIKNRIYKGKLYFLSGLSMYIADKLQKQFGILNNNEVQNRLQKLEPDRDIKNQIYLFFVDKISLVIICFSAFLILGVFNCISIQLDGNKTVTAIQRPDAGNGDRTFQLEAVNPAQNDSKEQISLTLDAYMMSNEEIDSLLDEYFEKLKVNVLGKNTDFDNITESLNFVYKEYQLVSVLYGVNGDGFLTENGSINSECVYEYYEKNETQSVTSSFSIILSYGNIDKEYEQSVVIKLEQKEKTLSEQIMQEINQNYSLNEKNIILPDNLNGVPIQYHEKKEKETLLFIVLGIIIGILAYIGRDKEIKKRLEKRNAQLEMDYASIVCKLTLLNEAGSTLLLAWDKIISDYESGKGQYGYRYAYEEMKVTRYRMKNGVSEAEAYAEFGRRCDTVSYMKLGCLLEQNIRKGTKGLKNILNGEVREAFAERKLLAKKRGEEASTKLLFPMLLMLLISMIVVIMPAFMSMNL